MTATPPKIGPKSMTRWWPIRSERMPKTGRHEQFRGEERGREQTDDRTIHLHAAVVRQVGEVEPQHRTRETGAEAKRERAGQNGPEGAVHEVQA